MPDELPDDDNSITDGQLLYRRIIPDPHALRPVEGGFRPMSGAIQEKDQPTSVDLASLSSPEETRDRDTSRPWHVAAIPVKAVRDQGCRIVRRPLDNNPAHAQIYGKGKKGSLTEGPASKIAKQSRVILLNPHAPPPMQS